MSPSAFNTELGNCDQIVWNYTLFLPKKQNIDSYTKHFQKKQKNKTTNSYEMSTNKYTL